MHLGITQTHITWIIDEFRAVSKNCSIDDYFPHLHNVVIKLVLIIIMLSTKCARPRNNLKERIQLSQIQTRFWCQMITLTTSPVYSIIISPLGIKLPLNSPLPCILELRTDKWRSPKLGPMFSSADFAPIVKKLKIMFYTLSAHGLSYLSWTLSWT